MKLVEKRVDELIHYGNNPRFNDDSVEQVAKSIQEFGYKVPIVIDKNNVIVCGHTRAKALKKLGIEKVYCVLADDLTDEQIKAFRLADNKVGEKSEWDLDLLDIEMHDLGIDMAQFGFEFLEEEEKEDKKQRTLKRMNLKAFEHYDYLVFVFDNQHDFLNVCNEFKIEKVDAGYTVRKLGIGRVLKGEELIKRIGHQDSDIEQEQK